MKRRTFLGSLGLGAAASTLAAPALAQSAPEITWRMQSAFPTTFDALYAASLTMSKYVADMTDGRFRIQSFAAGEIVAPNQIVDSVADGTVEMGHTASQYYHGKNPAFSLGTLMPFGFNTRMMDAWLVQGGGLDLLNTFYAKHGFYAIPGGNVTAQMGGWYRKEINTVADLQGLKMRVGGLPGDIMAKMGVVPTAIPGGDVYVSLERGTIDAAEFTGPFDEEKMGLYKVAPFYYFPAWWEGQAAVHFFINLQQWEALPDNYKAVLRAAAAVASDEVVTRYDYGNPAALLRLVGAGVELRNFSQDIIAAAVTAAKEVYAELNATNPEWKTLYDSIVAYRDTAYTYWQLTELSYDAMMVRLRGQL
jgi:TRAP-type mannitol/chloroaromatic compound transport system substrate-binding protein